MTAPAFTPLVHRLADGRADYVEVAPLDWLRLGALGRLPGCPMPPATTVCVRLYAFGDAVALGTGHALADLPRLWDETSEPAWTALVAAVLRRPGAREEPLAPVGERRVDA